MALLTAEIKAILEDPNGLVNFSNPSGVKPITTSTGDAIVENSYTKNRLTVDSDNKTITITRVAADTTDNNCVDIHTIDAVSAIGPVKIPGYVYTGNFSGCVFYLYKTGVDEVTGVHAYNGYVNKGVKPFFGKPKITRVVHEFGPKDYYKRNIGTKICRYPTRGELQLGAVIGDPTAENSLNYLSCVEKTRATTFLFSFQSGDASKGARVGRLLATHVKDF